MTPTSRGRPARVMLRRSSARPVPVRQHAELYLGNWNGAPTCVYRGACRDQRQLPAAGDSPKRHLTSARSYLPVISNQFVKARRTVSSSLFVARVQPASATSLCGPVPSSGARLAGNRLRTPLAFDRDTDGVGNVGPLVLFWDRLGFANLVCRSGTTVQCHDQGRHSVRLINIAAVPPRLSVMKRSAALSRGARRLDGAAIAMKPAAVMTSYEVYSS